MERPYEKALHYGVHVLSDAELLAIILRTGSSKKTSVELAYDVLSVSEAYPGLLGLYHSDHPDLMKIEGIGKVKALELMCVAELSKRMSRLSQPDKVRFRTPGEIAAYFMEELRSYESEHFYVVLFDNSSRLIKYEDMFKGTMDAAVVSPREAILFAFTYKATNMVILHNHPGGDPYPSDEDCNTTQKFYNACNYMGLMLNDHIIIGDNKYFSFFESGFINNNEINNEGED